MKQREITAVMDEPLPPNYTLDSIRPPKYWGSPGEPTPDPNAYQRKAVTSAHAIDLSANPPKLSARDSAAIGPSGAVVHGRYGELGEAASGIPLEYLALLRPAAEGAAAVRLVCEASKVNGTGTLLVYGATQPNALAAVQLASSSGMAVVAVVGGEGSGDDEMMDIVKGLAQEPGTAVPEEYALVKRNFRDLVQATVHGEDLGTSPQDADAMLAEFKANLVDYATTFPDSLPAAVSPDMLTLDVTARDRDNYRSNMEEYLSQFTAGSPPINKQLLEAYFTKEHYATFKTKFGTQTTAVISGSEDAAKEFNPAAIVRSMLDDPAYPLDEEATAQEEVEGAGPFVPYYFSVLDSTKIQKGLEIKKGGPIAGAIIAVTPDLQVAAEALDKAGPSLRAKAEALQFLTDAQRNAFAAASSVATIAKEAGGSIYVVGGSLPGLTTAEPTDADVKEALEGMEIDDMGESRLNYFIQIYRAGDYPIYADYAIHRATEALAGPRQIVVTK
eukprot:CAMPEP_0198289080 /NCGR_PEP_ID=MMETSP1449-20131203/7402_1 /TAXON_ID=420275 /ORGANISM="Attheya septentrionalis, Strain CCMP2084" /LENGTH=500 /DNA_ID=CAMNT_0043987357 /DNA_START=60 /DNA_END=1562 /DNA_ORIENTATION=+